MALVVLLIRRTRGIFREGLFAIRAFRNAVDKIILRNLLLPRDCDTFVMQTAHSIIIQFCEIIVSR